MNDRPTIALLASPDSTASTLYGMYDLLLSPGRDWQFLTEGAIGTPSLNPVVVSRDGKPFRASTGVWIHPDCALDDIPTPAIVCITDLFVAPSHDLTDQYADEIRWLRRWHEQGAIMATACSGAMLLADAGLLDGQEATTHWGYCDAMASKHPRVKIYRDRALVVTGEGQRLIMAGGGTAWHDLGLYLIARLLSSEEAMRVAKVYLLDWHHIGQQPFAALTCNRQVRDAAITNAQTWIAEHYDHEAPVTAMAKTSGLGERSFKRRFAQATGMSPLEYVHTLRLEEAKHMLETSEQPVEAVANEVGYEDTSFFGRLFRRKVGLTPASYRKRFGGMRRALQAEEPERHRRIS
jgi:transcriptional regulator GlxA family with amidase domain